MSWPLVLVDDVGRSVTLTAQARRMVSLAPSNTEILFTLGLGKSIVGATGDSDYPSAAKNLASVGTFGSPSLEKIVSLKPDLVLSAGGIQKKLVLELEKLGVPVVVLYPHDLTGVFNDILIVGRAGGKEKKARESVAALKKELGRVAKEARKQFGPHQPVVYFEMWDQPLTTAGAGSFIHELIEKAGGTNLAGDIRDGYPAINAETVLARKPDVILATYSGTPEACYDRFAKRAGWQDVPAVKNHHVYCDIDQDLLLRPGPRLIQGCEEILMRLKQVRNGPVPKKNHKE